LFSISPDTVISAASFDRINAQLEAWGYTVHKVPFAETAKMEGLLRCSTLPLLRD
jgi:N-dimethylarginine dimethylaminohydrolase